MKHIFLVVLATFALIGCKSTRVVQTGVKKDSITTVIKREIVHDTIYEIERDSATINALIKCVNKKPVIIVDTLETIKHKFIKPKIELDSMRLRITCINEAHKLFKRWKTNYLEKHTKEKEVITELVEVEKELSWWQKFLINLGLAAIGYIIFRLGKPYVLRKLS